MSPYTTITKVRAKCTKFGVNPLDPSITIFIADADAIIDATAKTTFTASQAAGSLVEALSTDIAFYYCIMWDVGAFTSATEAELTKNSLWDLIEKNLSLLQDESTIKFLTS